ncbi:methyl-accepting chemotaxis protein [Hydrogenophaga laconesensis]|uniref:Methyl-accepting chemotaxis protein n=1 Tax=Hydrogenophaga laconesensis TaxID=1805971 RepID=A0ABU1VGV3_9BURK|nr:methyl-accepting chemotaxis protein [Hydrogenophaga laconesensis]MDR7096701.1 methyl-accepting chemotaxis protein [Hydrogenophaga laconesensis]
MSQRLNLGQRLLLINTVLVLLLLTVAGAVWFMMDKVVLAAERINHTNVPQLQHIAELELNVTRTSLQVRHAILSRNPAELNATLADIGNKKRLLYERLKEFGDGMIDDAGRQAYAPLPALMDEFWRRGEANVKLIQEGRKDDAFAYLVDNTIPARNALLTPLAAEKKRQGDRLAFRIGEIQSLSQLDRNIVVVAVMLVALGLVGLAVYLRRVVNALGADPEELKRVADAVAAGDLGVSMRVRSNDSNSALAALRTMTERLTVSVQAVRQSAESVSNGSTEIASGNSDLSRRTESQASALEETSASMEQLGSTVSLNAENARTANQLAQGASTVAEQGGEVVNQVVETMKGIENSSHKIADIISVIDGIAFQTNILALNAAVEAARAGEQGRGFAVVAGEVRSLAQRSAQAAKEIKDLIGDSVDRVSRGVALADRAGSTMQEVVSSIRRVSDLVGEISSASAEQSAGVSQVGEAVLQMDQTTQQNAALVEQMSASATSLRQQAEDLVRAVAVFRLK